MLRANNKKIIIPAFVNFMNVNQQASSPNQMTKPKSKLDVLQPLRKWLDELEVQNRKLAHFIAKLIPAQCPFERDLMLFGRKIAHIPPMCKLNPLYEQFVGLRFRALCYLVDQCGEDIQSYC
ncbi:Mo-dependent nitrogenase C-terminal domain-containing protein [Nostocaceae cyanobacterium CENA369]|uniref:Mo-dependent nitrogenase C-terminal domain-containing protein n=1 Tax=Dendronalium phyllosphericum CENA369 TaxID=1725256 RepID=A0A8J7IMI0_9NOST|nr:Mo-dependent nitrogenase C-terminal domain-containing protein [Dendronalium phyllosphericum]MBH8577797.1 Mo-dependent nitrogenase C-terminal domain-containing protein [Dendronalium phyllosphericum CENA369]